MKGFTFKLRKEQLYFKNKIYQIIDNIQVVEEVNSDKDIEITLTFESPAQQAEFLDSIKKTGLGWNLS